VLAARVHKLVPDKIWKARYKQINHFESLLADSGTLIVKIYLHISKKEQEQRLLDREKDPDKAWKLSVGDWKERETWSAMTDAYEDALEKCNTDEAPWHIVPANHKWFRDLAIAQIVKEILEPHEKDWKESLKELGESQRKAIAEYRSQQVVK
jgi:polyphosphate kinase 2 (PPK2 family)